MTASLLIIRLIMCLTFSTKDENTQVMQDENIIFIAKRLLPYPPISQQLIFCWNVFPPFGFSVWKLEMQLVICYYKFSGISYCHARWLQYAKPLFQSNQVYFPQVGERALLGFAVFWECHGVKPGCLKKLSEVAHLPLSQNRGSRSDILVFWRSWELSNLLNFSSKAFLWSSAVMRQMLETIVLWQGIPVYWHPS